MLRFTLVAFLALPFALASSAAAPPTGYTAKVTVSGPTRMDWTFVVSNRSQADPPANLLGKDYDSTKQTYELFVPARKDAKKPAPAILFVSAGDEPGGWKSFEALCKDKGFVFIGVRGAGNNTPGPKRIRVILDCLDDVRRQIPLDPDRTYVSGFSGGGRIACAVAFALPEHFGGVLPLCAGGDLRDEQWLRFLAADRLSAALVTGESDFNRGEVERWKGPMWKELGVRTKVWTQAKLGHAMPSAATLAEAVAWLDEGAGARAVLAKKMPASRATPDAEANRADAARLLLKEGEALLAARATQYRGLMFVKGVSERWPDTEAGKVARKLLESYEAKAERPWEAEDIAELRKQFAAEARAISDYALNGIPAGSPYEKQRPAMAKRAVELWSALVADAPNSELAKEGKKKIPDLEELTKKQ
jgi:pimeloyl-ACP methyl ester carboxylesterase